MALFRRKKKEPKKQPAGPQPSPTSTKPSRSSLRDAKNALFAKKPQTKDPLQKTNNKKQEETNNEQRTTNNDKETPLVEQISQEPIPKEALVDDEPTQKKEQPLTLQLAQPRAPIIEPERQKNGGVTPPPQPEAPTITPQQATDNKQQTTNNRQQTTDDAKATLEEETWLKPLRTFRADAERIMKEEGTTVASMVLAEEKRRRGRRKDVDLDDLNKKKRSPIARLGRGVVITISFLLFLGGGSIITFLVLNQQGDGPADSSITVPVRPIFTEEERTIPLSSTRKEELVELVGTRIQGASLKINAIEEIIFTTKERVSQPDSIETIERSRPLSLTEILSIIESETPPSLLRAWSDEYLFGIHTFTTNNPFLIVTVTDFPNTVSGMLAWEPSMLDDLSALFGIRRESGVFRTARFVDDVIRNQDVRVVRNEKGDIIMLYTFADLETLIITVHDITLDELLKRVKRPQGILR